MLRLSGRGVAGDERGAKLLGLSLGCEGEVVELKVGPKVGAKLLGISVRRDAGFERGREIAGVESGSGDAGPALGLGSA